MRSAAPALLALLSACATPMSSLVTTTPEPRASVSSALQTPAASSDDAALGLRQATVDLRIGDRPPGITDSLRATPGALAAGERVWLLDSVAVGGEDWHLVVADRLADELTLPIGWIPAIVRGESTLSRPTVDCPRSPLTVEQVVALGTFGGLGCYGAQPIDLIGFAGLGCGAGGSARIGSPEWLNGAFSGFGVSAEEPGPPDYSVSTVVHVHLPPGGERPAGCERSGWFRFRAHYDDPAASTCRTEVADGAVSMVVDRRLSELLCRAAIVVTDSVPLDTSPAP